MLLTGSSPLARGTRRSCAAAAGIFRFIPAGAGNTARMRETAMGQPVHPRWRGEHVDRGNVVPLLRGSSPLARGTHHG